MIFVFTPTTQEIAALQAESGAYYWSACVEMLLRARGLVSIEKRDGPNGIGTGIAVITRGVRARHADDIGNAAFYEGPIDAEVAEHYEVQATPFEDEALDLTWANGTSSLLYYPVEYWRGEQGLAIEAEEPYWTNRRVRGQFISGDGWETLATARCRYTGQSGPAVIAKGPIVLSGIPFFDLAARYTSFPPLDGRYMRRDAAIGCVHEMDRIVKLIEELASEYSVTPIVKIDRWPVGYSAAFTVRHDYDREISDQSAADLLAFYRGRNVKCSIGFLPHLAPEEIVSAFVEDGHEIQLHTDSKTAVGFGEALAQIAAKAGGDIRGVTVHGGESGPGFVGDTQYGWAERCGLRYVELFATPGSPVAPVARISAERQPVATDLLGVRSHYSLDVSTTPGHSRYADLSLQLGPVLRSGEYVILMNHPDLNRKELIKLISDIDFSSVWRATQAEVCTWFSVTQFRSRVWMDEGRLKVCFAQKPVLPARVRIIWPGGGRSEVLSVGDEVVVKKGGVKTVVVIGSTADSLQALKQKVRSVFALTGAASSIKYLVQYGGEGPDPGTESAPGHFYSPGGWQCDRILLGIGMFGAAADAVVSYCVGHLAPGGQLVSLHNSWADGEVVCRPNSRPSVFSWFMSNNEMLMPEFSGALKKETEYLISGVLYKPAQIVNIARVLKAPLNGRVVDAGGALGYIGAEVSLSGFQEVVNVGAKGGRNAAIHSALARFLKSHKVAYTFVEQDVESFLFPDNNSLIIFTGALLYVERPLRAVVLERAFNSLKSGGILVVHENIKSERYDARHQALMFEPEELDGLLRGFGELRYFSNEQMEEVPAEVVGRKTVYRVVQK